MKKTVFFLLILLLSLSVCGCDLPAEENGRQDCIMLLHVTINPEFELALDQNEAVAAIRCLNDDAQALISEEDLIGKTYGEAMQRILQDAYTQGFLEENTTIRIEAVLQSGVQWTQTYADMLNAPVEHFREEQKLTLKAELSYSQSVADGGKEETNSGPRVETGTYEDGSQWEHTYNENGILVQEVITREAGDWDNSAVPCVKAITTYNDQGKPITSDNTYANGERAIITYHENGSWASCESIRPDGTNSVTTYDENGNVLDQTDKDAAGNVIKDPWDDAVCTYHPNGSVASKIYTLENGSVIEEYYDESGLMTRCVDRTPEGEILDQYYDENRVLIRYIYHTPDGFYSDESYTYYEDGSTHCVKSQNSDGSYAESYFFQGADKIYHAINIWPDGTRSETYYNEDNSIARTIDTANDVTWDRVYTYHANGNKASLNETASNGDYCTTTYYENGTMATYQAKRTDTGAEVYWDQTYSTSGILLKDIYQDPRGYREDTYDESGARLRKFYREPNGTESTTTYSSAGMECITVYPDGTRWIYATDPNGNVIKDGPL